MVVPATNFRSALVIQTKYIGDMVLSSAVTEGLRRAYPGIRVTMVCDSSLGDMVVDNGIADEAITFNRSRSGAPALRRIREIVGAGQAARSRGYDLAIDLTDGSTSQFIQLIAAAPVRVGYSPPGKPVPLINHFASTLTAPARGAGPRYLDRYLAPLSALGVDITGLVPRLLPTPERQREADGLLADASLVHGRFMAVHAGARTEPRRWPPERFAAVLAQTAARTGMGMLIVGGPDERPLAESIASMCPVPVASVSGRCPIATMPAVLSRAQLFLGNESGPMHMAAAVGIPVVGLYGRTDPVLWGPVSDRAIALQPSMPCACITPDLCQGTDSNKVRCVSRIPEGDVLAAIDSLLARTTAG